MTPMVSQVCATHAQVVGDEDQRHVEAFGHARDELEDGGL